MFFRKKKPQTPPLRSEKDLLKNVRRIEIKSRRMATETMAGEYQSAFRGRGVEFDMVREYQEGDEERMIDWNVTARSGRPYVKSYVEERELTVIFLVDVSASGLFGSRERLKKETAAEFCAVLAFSAVKNNDKAGLILFSDQIELFLPAKKGKNHILRIIRELLYFKPKNKSTSINAALEYFNRIHKRKTVAFLVSDFLDEGYFKNVTLTNKRHDLMAVDIYDRREEELSGAGLIELEDQETGELFLADTNSKSWVENYKKVRLEFNRQKQTGFKKAGVDYLRIGTDGNFERELARFFKNRGARFRSI